MKKILALSYLVICVFIFCACGAQSEVPVPAESPAGITSSLPDSNLVSNNSEFFDIASSYIDKSVDELISAIGDPISREYSSSCLGSGEDGNLEYDGFSVYTYKEGDSEVITGVSK